MTKQASVIIIPANPAEPVRRETVTSNLDTAQSIVGGWIEGLPSNMDEGWVAYGNEEAKMMGLPLNPRAHATLVALGGHNPQDHLRGNVFIVGIDDEGDGSTPVDVWGKVLAIPGVAPPRRVRPENPGGPGIPPRGGCRARSLWRGPGRARAGIGPSHPKAAAP
jgi:hypothetical protein